jgi:hypothetical protein
VNRQGSVPSTLLLLLLLLSWSRGMSLLLLRCGVASRTDNTRSGSWRLLRHTARRINLGEQGAQGRGTAHKQAHNAATVSVRVCPRCWDQGPLAAADNNSNGGTAPFAQGRRAAAMSAALCRRCRRGVPRTVVHAARTGTRGAAGITTHLPSSVHGSVPWNTRFCGVADLRTSTPCPISVTSGVILQGHVSIVHASDADTETTATVWTRVVIVAVVARGSKVEPAHKRRHRKEQA